MNASNDLEESKQSKPEDIDLAAADEGGLTNPTVIAS